MNPRPPIRQISPDRKAIYYGGMALSFVGILMFLGAFLTFANAGRNFDPDGAFGAWGIAAMGMILAASGRALMRVGVRGLSGSGLMLDPERARRDLEPWARSTGGLADDALSEMPTLRETLGANPAPPPIQVRCRACRALNDESSRFCGQCGGEL